MKIQIGEIYMDKVSEQKTWYPNKTRKYLAPCLKEYGSIFSNRLNNVFKVAVGIGDIINTNCGFRHEKHLFFLLDSKIASKYFISFLDWIREQTMYEDDYVFDDIQKTTFHMVVIKIPEKFYDSIGHFQKGEYSQMFDQSTIDAFFDAHSDVKRILIKDHDYRVVFANRLSKRYDTLVEAKDCTGELEFPPTDVMEVFNHHLK
jgi:hypothetical protein